MEFPTLTGIERCSAAGIGGTKKSTPNRREFWGNIQQFMSAPKAKSKPSEAGSIWRGGARERADDVIFLP